MIGYVLKMFPRFSETFILAEILELERLGRKIEIISLKKPDDGRFHENLASLGANVRYLPEHVRCAPLAYASAHARAAWSAPMRYLACLILAIRHMPEARAAFLRSPLVASAAAAARCDSLHAHFATLPAVTAMLAAELAGIPFSFTAHAKDIFLAGRSRRLLAKLIRRARTVITVSEFNRRYLEDLAGPRTPAGRIVRIYNGVDTGTFHPGAPRAEQDPPLILAVGRLVEKKGFTDLVEACAALGKSGVAFQCEIVGKGPLRGQLEERIASLGMTGRVRLTGALPRAEVSERLRRSALLAVPCVIGRDGNRDGLPTTILEAMASGVPVVATSVTGIPEAVADGVTGRVVDPGDITAFTSALEEILRDHGRRERMGMAARARAEELFDIRRTILAVDAALGAAEPPLGIRPDSHVGSDPLAPFSLSERAR